jgi:hypothetical protein
MDGGQHSSNPLGSTQQLPGTPVGSLLLTEQQQGLLLSAVRDFPEDNWQNTALSPIQTAYYQAIFGKKAKPLQALFQGLAQEVGRYGVCVVSLGHRFSSAGDCPNLRRVLPLLASAVCRPFGAFLDQGFFQTLGVRHEAQNMRAHSVGYIPFHCDWDQASNPPEYVALYCVRPDPFGGGESLVVDFRKVLGGFSSQTLSGLSDIEFSYAGFYRTFNIGTEQNPHPLIERLWDKNEGIVCRYNGKARPQFANSSKEAAAFDMLEAAFTAASCEYSLKPGDMILMDQRRILHARKPLAARPDGVVIPPDQDRKLLQFYGKPFTAGPQNT